MTVSIADHTINVGAPYYLKRDVRERFRRRLELGREIPSTGRIQVDGTRYRYATESGRAIDPPTTEVGHFAIHTTSIVTAVAAAHALYTRVQGGRTVDAEGTVQVDGRTHAYRTQAEEPIRPS